MNRKKIMSPSYIEDVLVCFSKGLYFTDKLKLEQGVRSRERRGLYKRRIIDLVTMLLHVFNLIDIINIKVHRVYNTR